MACGAGTALHRKPHGLVKHQHVVVLMQRDRLEKVAGPFVSLVARRPRLRRVQPQRRNPYRLAGLKPVLRLGPLAVDPHLAFADDALDVGVTETRKPRLEKPVDAHAGLVCAHGDILNGCRHRLRRNLWLLHLLLPGRVLLPGPRLLPRLMLETGFEGTASGPVALRRTLRTGVAPPLRGPMPRTGDLLTAAWLPRSTTAPHRLPLIVRSARAAAWPSIRGACGYRAQSPAPADRRIAGGRVVPGSNPARKTLPRCHDRIHSRRRSPRSSLVSSAR